MIGGKSDKGMLNDVWKSTDGKKWTTVSTSAPFRARFKHTSLIHNDFIYVIAGEDDNGAKLNDVWRSKDGTEWVKMTKDAKFEERSSTSAVSYNNKI